MTQTPERAPLTTDPAIEAELDHRMSRYGLNPCVTADTWVHTEWGARQVRELIGRQHGTYVNGELFSSTAAGFFCTGRQPVFALHTQAGYTLRLTGNHPLLKVTAQTQKAQYTEWTPAAQLQPGDRILLHNHRSIQPWAGTGTWAEGWLLGNFIGDGCFFVHSPSYARQGILRYWGESQSEMAEFALANCQTVFPGFASRRFLHQKNQYIEIKSAHLFKLAAHYGLSANDKAITPQIERASYEFYCGFLRGLFDADGSVQGNHHKGVSIRLAQSHLLRLQAVQRMLLRLGIVASIYKRRQAEMHLLPNAQRQLVPYACQTQYELVISHDNLWEFQRVIGFQEPQKSERLQSLLNNYQRNLNRERFTAVVTALIPQGEELVYDCTVPGVARFDANGFVAHNCGEIIGADFHCVAGNTLLITRSGLGSIQSLVGQVVEVWNGRRWSAVVPLLTGRERQLYRVHFGDGTWLDVTDYHRFFVRHRFGKDYLEMTTQEIQNYLESGGYRLHTEPFCIDYRDGECVDPIWAYTLGQLVGDGSLCQSHGQPQLQLRLYGAKSYRSLTIAGRSSGQITYYTENQTTPCLLYTGFTEAFNPEWVRQLKYSPTALESLAQWNREAILHFVAGLIDADGTGTPSGGVRLYVSNYDRAYRIYLLLLKCGIHSSINLCTKAGTTTNLGRRHQDLWYLQITDCQGIPCQRVDTTRGHQPPTKGKWQTIRKVELLPGFHDTYCFHELEVHKGVFGGTLTGQCNLAEIHLNQIDPHNFEEQERAFTAGALSVAALLNHRFVEPRFQYSRELDPIVGVSFTGLFDFFVHAFGKEWLQWWAADRPKSELGLILRQKETDYLQFWRDVVHRVVWDYCDRHGLRRPNRCTTVQPAGCLDRTALRIFDQGLLYADEIVEPGSGESQGLGLTVRDGIPTDTAIANPPLPLVRVTLENGRVLRMTPNHRLSIADQWVRADQLKIGMEIDYSLGEYRHREDAPLISPDCVEYTCAGRQERLGHGRGVLTAEIRTPTTLNPELGYFLGCLFGDGALSECKNRVRFAFNEKELDLVERLQGIAQRQFGLEGKISHDVRNGGTRGELVFASKQLFDWLQLNQLQKPNSKDLERIPLAIRKSSRETILAFFCGLVDTDGCVRSTGSLCIDASSETFIRNLQQVAEAVGLCFSIYHNTQGENFQYQKDMWGLSLSRMWSQPEALAYLNTHSRKCQLRPLPEPKRQFAFHPYRIIDIEWETTPDYSYDFAVSGIDDDDSWYWQGALKSHNTKSLLTNASPGWHPPKAQRYIRRITFAKNDPVALACMDYGYSVVPGQSDKDEQGNLLNDPFDPRCSEWLVEIPVAVSWADIADEAGIDISRFNALAQFDFYMNVQRNYTTHNTSATIEFREYEIEALADRIYQAIQRDEGYISAALLSRFDALQTFPRLPFEPISKEQYEQLVQEVLQRRKLADFGALLRRYDQPDLELVPQVAACEGVTCELPAQPQG